MTNDELKIRITNGCYPDGLQDILLALVCRTDESEINTRIPYSTDELVLVENKQNGYSFYKIRCRDRWFGLVEKLWGKEPTYATSFVENIALIIIAGIRKTNNLPYD